MFKHVYGGLPNVEVLHVDILVGSGLPLTPQEKTFFCRSLCSQEKVKGSRSLGMLQYYRNKHTHTKRQIYDVVTFSRNSISAGL